MEKKIILSSEFEATYLNDLYLSIKWLRSLISVHKPKTSEVGSSAIIHLKYLGFQTLT
jgi:hypothetical protein